MKSAIALNNPTARQTALRMVQSAPDGHVVEVSEAKRTLDQNAVQWPILNDFATQLQWPINGQMTWMQPDEWKDVLTAAFKNETARLAMGLDGGVVMLGSRTSKFKKAEFSEWIEFLKATASARGVRLSAYKREIEQ